MESGTTLGSYEIVAPLGAGGMGEVYRARDTKLERAVALKVLPSGLATHPDALARFEREAKLLASLNHPNIAAIHGIEEFGGVRFLILELVEGMSLEQRLARGPLPAAQALQIGKQVAEALEAAHREGVVHRDLKPANVMLTPQGTAKVLDFGIAKAASGAGRPVETQQATDLTKAGSVLGTAPYMSPEQVRGEVVDKRADIWAFGCVLYEALTGKKAFARETVADTLASILETEPEWQTLSSAPDPVRVLLRRCLQKDPGQRFHDVADARLEIEEILRQLPETRSARQSRRRWLPIAAVVLLSVAMAAALSVWQLGGGMSGLDPGLLAVASFQNDTGDAELDPLGRLATDTAIQGITETRAVQVVPVEVGTGTARSAPASSTVEELVATARRSGAATAIAGHYLRQGDDIRFRADLIDVEEARILYGIAPVEVSSDDQTAGLEALRQQLMGMVAAHFGIESTSPLTAYMHRFLGRPEHWSKIPDYDAYIEFLRGMELYGQDWDRSLSHWLRATELDPEFIPAWLWIEGSTRSSDRRLHEAVVARLDEQRDRLSPWERYRLEFGKARTRRDPVSARRWAERALAVHPEADELRWSAESLSMSLNEPARVVARFSDWEPRVWFELGILPGQWFFGTLTSAHHLLGNYDEELQQARRALEYYPDALAVRVLEVRALSALGRIEEIDAAVDDSLSVRSSAGTPLELMVTAAAELRAHGRPDAGLRIANRAAEWLQSQPAQQESPIDLAAAMSAAERWEEAHELYEAMSAEDPEDIEVLGSLGTMAARLGDTEAARLIAGRIMALDQPNSFGRPSYWDASIAALLGDSDGAIRSIRRWISEAGEINYIELHRDPNFESLRDRPDYREIVRPRG